MVSSGKVSSLLFQLRRRNWRKAARNDWCKKPDKKGRQEHSWLGVKFLFFFPGKTLDLAFRALCTLSHEERRCHDFENNCTLIYLRIISGFDHVNMASRGWDRECAKGRISTGKRGRKLGQMRAFVLGNVQDRLYEIQVHYSSSVSCRRVQRRSAFRLNVPRCGIAIFGVKHHKLKFKYG